MFRLLALLLLLQTPASAGQLRGRVLDGATKEPLARVHIRLEAKTIAAVTDAFGRFAIDDLAAGEYVLKVTTVGFLPLTQSITISDNTPDIEMAILPDTLRRKVSVKVTTGPFGSDSAFSLSMQGSELRNLSTVMIDDLLRAVQSLPVVTAGDDLQAQFSMCGAEFDRIGVYVDGLLMHSPLHTVQGDQTCASLLAVQGEMLKALM